MVSEKLVIDVRPTLLTVVNMLEVVWSDLVSFTQLGSAHFLNVCKCH